MDLILFIIKRKFPNMMTGKANLSIDNALMKMFSPNIEAIAATTIMILVLDFYAWQMNDHSNRNTQIKNHPSLGF